MKTNPQVEIIAKKFTKRFALSARRIGRKFWVVLHPRGSKTPRAVRDAHWVPCDDRDDCLSYYNALLNQ